MNDPTPPPSQSAAEPTASRPFAAWVAAAVGVVLLAFFVLLATRDANETGVPSIDLDGELAPPIVGVTLDGERFDLDDMRGQFVVVNFFQTTCVPCRVEHPELVSFHDAYAEQGIASVVSVAFDDNPERIRDFFAHAGFDNNTGAGKLAVDEDRYAGFLCAGAVAVRRNNACRRGHNEGPFTGREEDGLILFKRWLLLLCQRRFAEGGQSSSCRRSAEKRAARRFKEFRCHFGLLRSGVLSVSASQG